MELEKMNKLTEKQAVDLFKSEFWKTMTDKQITEFQLNTPRLCMPFFIFHQACEKTLGRSIFTHEFASPELLRKELNGEKPKPTFDEIINLIPKDKRVIVLKL